MNSEVSTSNDEITRLSDEFSKGWLVSRRIQVKLAYALIYILAWSQQLVAVVLMLEHPDGTQHDVMHTLCSREA